MNINDHFNQYDVERTRKSYGSAGHKVWENNNVTNVAMKVYRNGD